jgi:hypothetical protein
MQRVSWQSCALAAWIVLVYVAFLWQYVPYTGGVWGNIRRLLGL